MIDIGTNDLLDIWLRNRGNEDVDGLCKAVEARGLQVADLEKQVADLQMELADERSGRLYASNPGEEEDIFG
jgi:hypothetical protein